MSLFFALSTPVGVLVAISMSATLTIDATVEACLQACVAGTFLYISIIEVGMKELLVCRVQAGASILGVGSRLEIGKLLAFVVGYLSMAVLAIYV